MISVVMTTYNSSEFVREAIESTLNQTYRDFEFIIVDDGSTDDTCKIVLEYIAQDKRIRLIQAEHGGIAKAANRGIEAARYEWIARMDSDDVMMPDRLEKQVTAAQANPHVILWSGHAIQINRKGKHIGLIEMGPTTDEEYQERLDNFMYLDLINPTTMMRRDLVLEVGGYSSAVKNVEDGELWSRLTRCEGTMRTIPEPLIYYRIHGNSVTVKKTAEQGRKADFIIARNKAWAAGDDLTWEEFAEQMRNEPLLKRLHRRMYDYGRTYYRAAGVHIAENRYPRAVLTMLMAAFCAPNFTISRILARLNREKKVKKLAKAAD